MRQDVNISQTEFGMLSFNGLALRRSSTLLFEAVDLKIYPGQKLGITGANGCGKSSLFALIRGELGADQGDFSIPQQWALAWVEQETSSASVLRLNTLSMVTKSCRRVEAQSAAGRAEAGSDADCELS